MNLHVNPATGALITADAAAFKTLLSTRKTFDAEAVMFLSTLACRMVSMTNFP